MPKISLDVNEKLIITAKGDSFQTAENNLLKVREKKADHQNISGKL